MFYCVFVVLLVCYCVTDLLSCFYCVVVMSCYGFVVICLLCCGCVVVVLLICYVFTVLLLLLSSGVSSGEICCLSDFRFRSVVLHTINSSYSVYYKNGLNTLVCLSLLE